MDQATHNKIVSFIWGIADDVLRDLFVRGKYRDVILPMCVLRRLDAVLEPTKQNVLDTKATLDKAGITEQQAALCAASSQAFYNTSQFTLRHLKSQAKVIPNKAAQDECFTIPTNLRVPTDSVIHRLFDAKVQASDSASEDLSQWESREKSLEKRPVFVEARKVVERVFAIMQPVGTNKWK